MTTEHRLLVEIAELKALRLSCAQCQSAVALTLDPNMRAAVPLSCPSCGTSWNDQAQHGMRSQLVNLLDVLRDVRAAETYRDPSHPHRLNFAFEIESS